MSTSSSPRVPDRAVAEAMRARRGWHSGVRVNTDVPEANAIRADLEAAYEILTQQIHREVGGRLEKVLKASADTHRREADAAEEDGDHAAAECDRVAAQAFDDALRESLATLDSASPYEGEATVTATDEAVVEDAYVKQVEAEREFFFQALQRVYALATKGGVVSAIAQEALEQPTVVPQPPSEGGETEQTFWDQAAAESLRRGGEIAREKGLLPEGGERSEPSVTVPASAVTTVLGSLHLQCYRGDAVKGSPFWQATRILSDAAATVVPWAANDWWEDDPAQQAPAPQQVPSSPDMGSLPEQDSPSDKSPITAQSVPSSLGGRVDPGSVTLAYMRAAAKVRDGRWVKGAPSHVFAEFAGALKVLGFHLVATQQPQEQDRLAEVENQRLRDLLATRLEVGETLYETVQALLADVEKAEQQLEDERRLRRSFGTQRDEAWAKLAAVRRALGEDGTAADVGAARAALAKATKEPNQTKEGE